VFRLLEVEPTEELGPIVVEPLEVEPTEELGPVVVEPLEVEPTEELGPVVVDSVLLDEASHLLPSLYIASSEVAALTTLGDPVIATVQAVDAGSEQQLKSIA